MTLVPGWQEKPESICQKCLISADKNCQLIEETRNNGRTPDNLAFSHYQNMKSKIFFRLFPLAVIYIGFIAGCMQRDQETILFLGDSLTEGFRLSADESFPAVLQQRLDQEKYEYRVINGGKSGNTTSDALKRLPELLKRNPGIDILIVFLGANDFFEAVPPVQVKENISKIVGTARAGLNDVKIYIIPFPALRTMVPDYEEGFNKIYTEIAREQDVKLLPFIMSGVFGMPEMNQADRVHPNARGARIMADNVFQILKERNIIRHH